MKKIENLLHRKTEHTKKYGHILAPKSYSSNGSEFFVDAIE